MGVRHKVLGREEQSARFAQLDEAAVLRLLGEPATSAVVADGVLGHVEGQSDLGDRQAGAFKAGDGIHGATVSHRNDQRNTPLRSAECDRPSEGHALLRFASRPVRSEAPTMTVHDRVSAILKDRGVSKAEIGRRLGMSGQAITLKLQGKRPITIEEFAVIAEMAGTTVASLLGDDAVILERDDELDLIEAYRQASSAQREMLRAMARELAGPKPSATAEGDGVP